MRVAIVNFRTTRGRPRAPCSTRPRARPRRPLETASPPGRARAPAAPLALLTDLPARSGPARRPPLCCGQSTRPRRPEGRDPLGHLRGPPHLRRRRRLALPRVRLGADAGARRPDPAPLRPGPGPGRRVLGQGLPGLGQVGLAHGRARAAQAWLGQQTPNGGTVPRRLRPRHERLRGAASREALDPQRRVVLPVAPPTCSPTPSGSSISSSSRRGKPAGARGFEAKAAPEPRPRRAGRTPGPSPPALGQRQGPPRWPTPTSPGATSSPGSRPTSTLPASMPPGATLVGQNLLGIAFNATWAGPTPSTPSTPPTSTSSPWPKAATASTARCGPSRPPPIACKIRQDDGSLREETLVVKASVHGPVMEEKPGTGAGPARGRPRPAPPRRSVLEDDPRQNLDGVPKRPAPAADADVHRDVRATATATSCTSSAGARRCVPRGTTTGRASCPATPRPPSGRRPTPTTSCRGWSTRRAAGCRTPTTRPGPRPSPPPSTPIASPATWRRGAWSFRPQRSARMLAEDDKHHLRRAPGLRAVDAHGAGRPHPRRPRPGGAEARRRRGARRARRFSPRWDRTADNESRGGVLFAEWVRTLASAAGYDDPSFFAVRLGREAAAGHPRRSRATRRRRPRP